MPPDELPLDPPLEELLPPEPLLDPPLDELDPPLDPPLELPPEPPPELDELPSAPASPITVKPCPPQAQSAATATVNPSSRSMPGLPPTVEQPWCQRQYVSFQRNASRHTVPNLRGVSRGQGPAAHTMGQAPPPPGHAALQVRH